MPLLSIWQSNPEAVSEFSIEQIVATAGDGLLLDGSACSLELTTYLSEVPSETLARYVQHCLAARFEKGGIVLQDLINELGRRLDYTVRNGRYQGTTNAIGFDGIWTSPDTHSIVVEVKTTDAYRISLDTLAGYRDRLVAASEVGPRPSMLIVVGRQDTGELEAQVRGSRHAWDIRIISAESLIKLVQLKENSDEPETVRKIRSVLLPVEYTRVDRLVDVLFTTAIDTQTAVDQPELVETAAAESAVVPGTTPTTTSDLAAGPSGWEFTDPASLNAKREELVRSLGRRYGEPLIRTTRALYWSKDHQHRAVCTISKRYDKRPAVPYWYAYHPAWDDFLRDATDDGILVLGCMDLPFAFAIPRSVITSVLDKLHTTTTERGRYWHLHISEDTPGNFELVVPRGDYLTLGRFKLDL